MLIREIRADEFAAYWDLRLYALQESQAFGRSYEVEAAIPLAERIKRMQDRISPENIIFVVEDGKQFGGMTGVARNPTPKIQHIAFAWGVYVMPTQRGQGLGRQLMERAIAQAKKWSGVKQIQLTVVATNTSARQLYQNLGFVEWGIEPAALFVNGIYFDEVHMAMSLD